MSISDLRRAHQTVSLGLHQGVIQSMLDYEYMIGRDHPSLMAVVAGGRKQCRFFWGEREIIVPVYDSIASLPRETKKSTTMLLNVQSARRVLASTQEAMLSFDNLVCMTIFAEQVPERHSLDIAKLAKKHSILMIGPASVGILIPGYMKLGAIGGTMPHQLEKAGIATAGDTAVVSTSGGMVNELIHMVGLSGNRVSFAVALGGDRFPVTTPAQAMLLAEYDPATARVVFFGELGGQDEYEIARLVHEGKITKKVYAYVAGEVADLFESPPQFGHAKAIASHRDESAAAKKKSLEDAGVVVAQSLKDIFTYLNSEAPDTETSETIRFIKDRQRALIASRLSGDIGGVHTLLGDDFLKIAENYPFESLLLSMLIGKKVESQKLASFTNYVLRLLVDHGPYNSGAINTIVAARAGKDLVSSLAAGLLTIGPRFGGAVNEASRGWLRGVTEKQSPKEFVQSFRANGGIIPGIGHKKYRVDLPDPRVEKLLQFRGNSNGDRYTEFALGVQNVTTGKKGNLILNVDGCIAAIMLDLFESELRLSKKDIDALIEAEFFNALFVLSRSVGLAAHYMDQRRNDEGLFRFSSEQITYIP